MYAPISSHFKGNLVLIFQVFPLFFIYLDFIQLIMFQIPLLNTTPILYVNYITLVKIYYIIWIQIQIWMWRVQKIPWYAFIPKRKYVPLEIFCLIISSSIKFWSDQIWKFNIHENLYPSWWNLMNRTYHIFHCDISIEHTQEKNYTTILL